jgi:hypothetical protein
MQVLEYWNLGVLLSEAEDVWNHPATLTSPGTRDPSAAAPDQADLASLRSRH